MKRAMEMRGAFTPAQREVLLRPIMKNRVSTTQGMSYVEAYDVIAHLNRLFGFEGWDKEILSCEVLFEDCGPKSESDRKVVWTVGYKASMRLTVYDPDGAVCTVKEDVSVGDAQKQPSRADAHDLAMKSAVSTALKRCAKDLGDGFGLSLYDHGSTDALVKKVVPYGTPAPAAEPEVTEPFKSTDGHGNTFLSSSPTLATRGQQTKLRAALHGVGINDNDDVHQWCSAKLRTEVTSLNTLTSGQVSTLIDEVGK